MQVSLPVELIRQIIQLTLLASSSTQSYSTLLRCSKVSQLFRELAQEELLRNTKINGYERWHQLLFSGLLTAENERNVKFNRGSFVRSIEVNYLAYTSHSSKDLRNLLELCPNVESLRVKGTGGVNLSDLNVIEKLKELHLDLCYNLLLPSTTSLPNLQHLSILNPLPNDFNLLFKLATSFPSLTSLSITSGQTHNSRYYYTNDFPTNITHLTIGLGSLHPDYLLLLVTVINNCLNLQSLTIVGSNAINYSVQPFIGALVLPIKLRRLKFIPAVGGSKSGEETLEAILISQENYISRSLIEAIYYHEIWEDMIRGLKVWRGGKILFIPHDEFADWGNSSQQMSTVPMMRAAFDKSRRTLE